MKLEPTGGGHQRLNPAQQRKQFMIAPAACSDYWASIGECDNNPVRMVGDSTHEGLCLAACGMCDGEGDKQARAHEGIWSAALIACLLACVLPPCPQRTHAHDPPAGMLIRLLVATGMTRAHGGLSKESATTGVCACAAAGEREQSPPLTEPSATPKSGCEGSLTQAPCLSRPVCSPDYMNMYCSYRWHG